MKTNIKEVFKKERKVVKEENNVLMDTLTRGIGKMIITKEKALKPGKMEKMAKLELKLLIVFS